MSYAGWNKRTPPPEVVQRRDALGAQPLEAADSLWTAPGWCILGDDLYTLIPPSDGPRVDPTVLAAIRSFDPGVIPFWRKQFWLFPDKVGKYVFSHICIGRHVRNPHRTLPPFRVETPVGYEGEIPNEIELVLEHREGTGAYDSGGPGAPAPFSMGLYHTLRGMFNEMVPGEKYFERLAQRKKERLEKEKLAQQQERRYRAKWLQPFIEKQLEKASSTEFQEYQARQRAGRTPRPYAFLRTT